MNKVKASIFTANRTLAGSMKEKCKSDGLDLVYISKLSDFLTHLIYANNEIIFVDEHFGKVKDILSDFCQRYDNNIRVIYLSEREGFEVLDRKMNTYRSSVSALPSLMPVLMETLESFHSIFSNIPNEELFKVVANSLNEFKILPKFLGYKYLVQAIAYVIKHCSNKINLNDDIYKYLSKQNNTTVFSIEKDIRMAISKALKDYPALFSKVTTINKKITNAIFITHIVGKVKMICMKECLEV